MKATRRQWIGSVALLWSITLLMDTMAIGASISTSSTDNDLRSNNEVGEEGGEWDVAGATVAGRRRRLREEVDQPPPAETERFHPEKGVLNMKGDQPVIDPLASSEMATASSMSTPSGTAPASSSSSTGINANPKRVKGKEDGTTTSAATADRFPNATTTNTATEETFDENNTAEVSLSVALPLPWNLTTTHPKEAAVVNAFVDDVSTAATKLFHTTLAHSITMLDGSPHLPTTTTVTSSEDDEEHPDVEEDPHPGEGTPNDNVVNHDNGGPSTSHSPWGGFAANYTFSSHTPAVTSDNDIPPDDDASTIWGLPPTTMNHSSSKNNSAVNSTQGHLPSNEHPKEPWDWMGMESLTKEELYKMVLEFLDIDDEEDWHNASVTSPLLRNLKAEIRHAIYGFFFQQQQQRQGDGMMHHRNETAGDGGNSSFVSNHHFDDDSLFDNLTSDSFWIPGLLGPGSPLGSDQHDPDGAGGSSGPGGSNGNDDHPNFEISGLWEMFLLGTRVELVVVQDTYSWWQITMIYPVYIHYQASYNEEFIHNQADYQLDDSVQVPSAGGGGGGGAASGGGGDANNVNATSEELEQQQQQQQSQQQHQLQDGAGATVAAAAEATETRPYWVPVTDQGTLDFISRLLQRVLTGAVDSGAFLSSLESLQVANYNTYHQKPQHMTDIVGEILALTVPGEEHPIQELISPFDDMEDEMETQAPKGVETQPPLQPPWGSGTYTHGVLDRRGHLDKRQKLGVLLLLMTFAVTSGMVLMAVLRNVTNKRSTEKAWLLGTDEDVAELLQVGWRQYDVSDDGVPSNSNSNRPADGPEVAPQRAEVIEVFDKSREGYYDNDSMLHGSAMQQSNMYDGSEVPSAPMEYEKHLERHQGRGEKNMFAALKKDGTNGGGGDDAKTREDG